LTIPAVCIPSSSTGATLLLGVNSPQTTQASLGLVRPTFDDGPSPWAFSAVGNQAQGRFTEWRTEWSGSAMGQTPSGFCVAFTPKIIAGSASGASISIALSSKTVYGLAAQYTPDSSVDAYVGRFGSAGGIAIFKNSQNVASNAGAKYNLNYIAALYVENGIWAVEIGNINGSSPLLRYEDANAFVNINYFSFTSSGPATVEFANIGQCPSSLMQGLVQSQGHQPGNKVTYSPVKSNKGATTTPQPTTLAKVFAPTASPEVSWSASKCKKLNQTTCSIVSNGACQWISKKCYFVISEG